MGDLVSQDVDFWAKSTPPGDGTCPFDRLPTEIVQNILSRLDAQAPRGVNPLLALRQTCRLFNMLCARLLSRRRVIFEGPDAHTQDEVPAQPFLSVVISSAPRARSVRKLAFDDASSRVLQQFLQDIAWWTAVLVNVEEVVLSSTQRIKLSSTASRASKLRHLSLAHADLATFSRDPRFLHLVTLVLSSVTLSEPWFLGRHAMPALRRLSITDCGVPRPPDPTQRWTTDLLPQLELLDIGESRRADANVGLILPLADLPDALPVVWRIDVDRALVRVTFPRPRAVLRRHAFVRLTVDDDDAPASSTGRPGPPSARPERLAKILDILALLPYLELLLVPHDLWPPLAHPAPASQAQQAIIDQCTRRGIALRTYERRAAKEEGLVPEFEVFLRERAQAVSEAG